MTFRSRIDRLEERRRRSDRTPLQEMTDAEVEMRVAQLRALAYARGEGKTIDEQLLAAGMTDADLVTYERLAAGLI